MSSPVINVLWTVTKAFFFLLGVYWLFSTAFDFALGRDGDEYGVLLALVLAIGFTILDGRQSANSKAQK